MRGHEVEGFHHREAVLRVAIVGDMGTFGVRVGAEFLDRGDLGPFPGEPTPRRTAARSLRPRCDRRGGRLRAACSQAVNAVNRTWWRPGECCD